jgi:biotin synthase-like enzyme
MYKDIIGAYSFEVGMYRPPSEGGSYSLLLRFTRNCPWNKCTFCGMYKQQKFSLRSVEEIKEDINSIAGLCMEMQDIARDLGYEGVINRDVICRIMERYPYASTSNGFGMILNWISSGAKTAFLQDANSLIMGTDNLVKVLEYLRDTFPSIERVTTYARSKTLFRKTQEELNRIRQAGLDRLHVGLESGDDEVLKRTKKGVTPEEHIEGGRKAMKAGFQLSEYWMPGLGGKQRWENHARHTAHVLNSINPHYIRTRPFGPWPGTPIYDKCERGELTLLTPEGQLEELKLMVQELDVTSKLCFDHANNYWTDNGGQLLFTHSYEGYQMPEKKEKVLEIIEKGIIANKGRSEYGYTRMFS